MTVPNGDTDFPQVPNARLVRAADLAVGIAESQDIERGPIIMLAVLHGGSNPLQKMASLDASQANANCFS